jgi:hypothetical protein
MSENRSDRVLEVAHANPGRARACPQCHSVDLLALGRVLADTTGIRSTYRCRECATEFLLPTERRRGPRDRRATPERRVGPERRMGKRDRRANR